MGLFADITRQASKAPGGCRRVARPSFRVRLHLAGSWHLGHSKCKKSCNENGIKMHGDPAASAALEFGSGYRGEEEKRKGKRGEEATSGCPAVCGCNSRLRHQGQSPAWKASHSWQRLIRQGIPCAPAHRRTCPRVPQQSHA